MSSYLDGRGRRATGSRQEGGWILAAVTPAHTWGTPLEALRIVFLRTTLRKTVRIALVVGTILSLINQAGIVFGGDATAVTWIRVGANYLVPFCVSSLGFLSATKRSSG